MHFCYFAYFFSDLFHQFSFLFPKNLGGGICIINDNANAQILATNIENTNIYNNKCGSNTTQGDGAGIYIKNKNPISVKVRNVTFEGNEIIEGEGGRGGGLAIEGNGAILTHLSFSGNIAAFGGGLGLFFLIYFALVLACFGLFLKSSIAIIGSSEVTELRDVIFYNNSAKNYGGGYYCLLSNCSLAGIYQDNQVRKKNLGFFLPIFLLSFFEMIIYFDRNINSLLFRRNTEVELQLINQL